MEFGTKVQLIGVFISLMMDITTKVSCFTCPTQYKRKGGTCCQLAICQKDEGFHYCNNTNSIGRDRCYKCEGNRGSVDAVNTSIVYEALEGELPVQSRCLQLICQCNPEAEPLKCAYSTLEVICQCKRPHYHGHNPNSCDPTPKHLVQQQHKAGYELTLNGTVMKCKDGTYKAEDDDSLCKPHDQCLEGKIVIVEGTTTSNVVCGPPPNSEYTQTTTQIPDTIKTVNGTESRNSTNPPGGTNKENQHIGWIIAAAVIITAVGGVGVCVCLRKGRGRTQQDLSEVRVDLKSEGNEINSNKEKTKVIQKDSGLSLNEPSDNTTDNETDIERQSVGSRSQNSDSSSGRGSEGPDRHSTDRSGLSHGAGGGSNQLTGCDTEEDPHITNVEPHSTSVEPHSTNVEPQRTSVEPHSTSVEPHSTNVEPHSTNVEPHSTSVEPHSTNVEPHSTSVVPDSGEDSTTYLKSSCGEGSITSHRSSSVSEVATSTDVQTDVQTLTEHTEASTECTVRPPEKKKPVNRVPPIIRSEAVVMQPEDTTLHAPRYYSARFLQSIANQDTNYPTENIQQQLQQQELQEQSVPDPDVPSETSVLLDDDLLRDNCDFQLASECTQEDTEEETLLKRA